MVRHHSPIHRSGSAYLYCRPKFKTSRRQSRRWAAIPLSILPRNASSSHKLPNNAIVNVGPTRPKCVVADPRDRPSSAICIVVLHSKRFTFFSWSRCCLGTTRRTRGWSYLASDGTAYGFRFVNFGFDHARLPTSSCVIRLLILQMRTTRSY